MNLRWEQQNGRMVGFCGEAAIGAIFPNDPNRYTRWRIWVSKNLNPTDGVAASNSIAKLEVEKRFEEFLTLANLEPRK